MTNRTSLVIALTTVALSATALTACSDNSSEVAAPEPTSTTSSNQTKTPDSATNKSLVIGIDGATFATMDELDLPSIAALRSAGMTSRTNLGAGAFAPTLSGPGWSSMVTGVWPDKHDALDNEFKQPNFDQYPDYLTRLEGNQPDADTYVSGAWPPIPQTVFGPTVDERRFGLGDGSTTDQAVENLKQPDAGNVFVDLDEVDAAGHTYGSSSTEYAAALKSADERVGMLIDAVEARASYEDEDWLIILTTDHGHTPTGGHGAASPAEREVFVIAAGTGIEADSQRSDVKLVDIAPTVLAHLGVPIDPTWNLDGTPLGDLKPDDFDTAYDRLKKPADETGLRADTIGWTDEFPKGWTADDTKMPTGGPQEWDGWALTTDEFWTNTKLDEGRDANVRSRDVFAVADATRWAAGNPDTGRFAATLVSPEFEVEGGKDATIVYVTTYQRAFEQSAEVLVSFDGAEPVRIRAYGADADVNATERITLPTPKGASTAQVSFDYSGATGGFWTIDQVSVTSAG
jgi:hypothetical protein